MEISCACIWTPPVSTIPNPVSNQTVHQTNEKFTRWLRLQLEVWLREVEESNEESKGSFSRIRSASENQNHATA
jgi:hypothetical protein